MKRTLLIVCMFITESAVAGVYRCEMPSGKVIYQSQVCPDQNSGREVVIEKFDQSKIEAAQKKLEADLKKQAEIDAKQAKENTRLRQIKALEDSNKAQEDVTKSTIEQTEALERLPNFYLKAE